MISALRALLDADIDAAVIDGRKTMTPRILVAGVTAMILGANVHVMTAVVWLALALGVEAWGWIAGRGQARGRAGTSWERVQSVSVVAVMTAIWTLVPILYWFSSARDMQLVAIVIVSAQLIHAQAFTFRSKIMLAASGGIPALTLTALIGVFGGFSGVTLITALLGVALMLGYATASAMANIKTSKGLRDAQAELEQIAYFDVLTSLANRRRFTEDLRKLMAYSTRHGTKFALLLVDLDRFKTINDTLGHDAGDALLIEAAARLQRAVRDSDSVARLGGDEFAILLEGTEATFDIDVVCQRIVDSFAEAVEFNGAVMRTTPSLGVAVFPEDGDVQANLYKVADLALYEAKRGGRHTWRIGRGEGHRTAPICASPTRPTASPAVPAR